MLKLIQKRFGMFPGNRTRLLEFSENHRVVSEEAFRNFVSYFVNINSGNLRTPEELVTKIETEISRLGIVGVSVYLRSFLGINRELVISFSKLKIEVSESLQIYRDRQTIIYGNGIIAVRIEFTEIHFANPSQDQLEFAPFAFYNGGASTSVLIKDSVFDRLTLDLSTFARVEIQNSYVHSRLIIGGEIQISDSDVGDLQIGTSQIIKIENSKINSVNEQFFAGGTDSLKFLHFDTKSSISNSQYLAYKALRTFAQNKGDKILAFTLFKKELTAFSGERTTDVDTKVLFVINKLANNNGTSFILPLVWLILSNCLFVSLIYVVSFYDCSLKGSGYLYNMLSFLPIDSLVKDTCFSNLAVAIDSLRRMFSGVFIFLIVSSALRFRYKI